MNGNGGELASFLEKLRDDPQLQQAYASDPEGTLRQAGLSDETIQTILSRDLEKIKAVLDRDLGGVHYMLFMVITEPKL
jgi:Aromatic-ring-opening dioxygenase LigAB, LigA subunit